MHGFLSRDGQAPSDLLATAHGEIAQYGAATLHGTATSADTDGMGRFIVSTPDGRQVSSRRLLIATGPVRRPPGSAGTA